MKQIKVTKREIVTCSMCGNPAEYWISYNDPLNPGPEHTYGRDLNREPTVIRRSCTPHVVDVTYRVLVEAKLAPNLPLDNLLEDRYAGTTGEPKA